MLISVGQLLETLEKLGWGGYRVRESMELRYRVTKAAVKSKQADELAPELAEYPLETRKELEAWLQDRWDLKLDDWSSPQQAKVWKRLGALTLEGKKSGLFGSLRRVAWRITRPTGLVVTNVNADQDAAVVAAFNRLYFRRSGKLKSFQAGGLKKLLVSTLLRCDGMGGLWKRLLGRDLWLEASSDESPAQLVRRIATHLNQRCLSREGVNTTSP